MSMGKKREGCVECVFLISCIAVVNMEISILHTPVFPIPDLGL